MHLWHNKNIINIANDYWKPIWHLEAWIGLSLSLSTTTVRFKIVVFKEILFELNFFSRFKWKVSGKKYIVTFLFSSIITPAACTTTRTSIKPCSKYLVAFYKKNCILYNLYSHFYYQKITLHGGYSLLDKMGS